MLGLVQLYFPVFEEALDRHGTPQELKYLAVVESALFQVPSRGLRPGLGSSRIGTGKMYGLEVDSYGMSAAIKLEHGSGTPLSERPGNRIFGNWELALAAYNCGPGNEQSHPPAGARTIGACTTTSRETRGYVPAFIAVNYLFNHAADYNIYPVIPNYCSYEVDTVQVCYPLDPEQAGGRSGGSAQEILT